jgi:hypothetical protein
MKILDIVNYIIQNNGLWKMFLPILTAGGQYSRTRQANNGDGSGAARSLIGLQGNGSVDLFQHPFGNCQAQARTFAAGGKIGFKEVRPHIVGNADPGIPYLQDGHIILFIYRDRQCPAPGHGLECIGDNIG